jgi:hypothetical protein
MQQKNILIYLFFILNLLNGCGGGSTTKTEYTPYSEASNSSTEHSPVNNYARTNTNTSIDHSPPTKKIIDLLILVDKNDTNSLNGVYETKIDHFIAVTNNIFKNSTLNVEFHIQKIQPYTFEHQNSKEVLYDIYSDKNISEIRDETKADLVVIYRKYANDGSCGIAYINDVLDKDIGYAHVSLECPSASTSHEIGHTMGLTHSEHKPNEKGLFSYARGYGVDGEFATIMAYKSTYHTNIRVLNYSSPELNCKGYECGVNEELDNGANAVKALEYAIEHVSHFR